MRLLPNYNYSRALYACQRAFYLRLQDFFICFGKFAKIGEIQLRTLR